MTAYKYFIIITTPFHFLFVSPRNSFTFIFVLILLIFDVIYQKQGRVLYRGFKTLENVMKKKLENGMMAFIVFECFETPGKHDMASQTSVIISWNFFPRIGHEKV